jgi:hypothetical protein
MSIASWSWRVSASGRKLIYVNVPGERAWRRPDFFGANVAARQFRRIDSTTRRYLPAGAGAAGGGGAAAVSIFVWQP